MTKTYKIIDILHTGHHGEKGERKMLRFVNKRAIKDAELKVDDIDLYLGGDLMNQNTATNSGVVNRNISFMDVYSACATFNESLILTSLTTTESSSFCVLSVILKS